MAGTVPYLCTCSVLWAEPRPERPPARVRRDWVLLGVLLAWSVLEALLREDLAWRPVALGASVVVALALLWRRTIPWPLS